MSVTYTLLNYFAIRAEIMYPAKCQSVRCTVGNRLTREANFERRQYRSPSLGMSWASSIHLQKLQCVSPGSVFALFSYLPLGVATFYEVSHEHSVGIYCFPLKLHVQLNTSILNMLDEFRNSWHYKSLHYVLHFTCKYSVEYLNLERRLFPVLSSRKASVCTTVQNLLQN
jgi:hypothetical protein